MKERKKEGISEAERLSIGQEIAGLQAKEMQLFAVIRNDLDAVREEIAKLGEKRDKIDISDPMYMIMSQEIIALTNEEVELMKEKALAGMARNYLS